MKVLGIGNAIIDVICKVEENFITENNLTKGTMKLFFDEIEFKSLLGSLKIEKTISGGSVANSIVGLSQLKNDVGFIGKISDDVFGSKYEEGLKKENVKYFYTKNKESLPTGTCLILVTPDSERTMCTFLGIAGKINEHDVDEKIIKKSELIFLEGYLWDEGEPITFAKEIKKHIVITRGEKGAISIIGDEITEIKADKNLTIKDLTGAGDLFAAGYLHGFINNLPTKECLGQATKLSSKVIQQIGARL